MTAPKTNAPFIAIACGGTGGHLFPGLAVAEQLKQRGCDVALLISPKDVDQQAVKSASGMEIFTLPAVALQNRNYFSFVRNFVKSWSSARKIFKQRQPVAVLAMGGFTSAPPIFAAKFLGIKTFLHESNTIPGRANRFLARFVNVAFVGFPETAARLNARKVTVTGTPVRPQFCSSRRESAHFSSEEIHSRLTSAATIENCRTALGLESNRPTILVVGGSQGASGLNKMVLSALPLLAKKNWQWLHLTGANDFEKVKTAYAARGITAVVKPFLAEMDLALGAATVAVSRAGASSLAEMAAMRLPSLLVPFPAAADNHQFFNARIYEMSGAARLLEQKKSTPEQVTAMLAELVDDHSVRSKIQSALTQWHAPKAAEQIAENILSAVFKNAGRPVNEEETPVLAREQNVPHPRKIEQHNLSAA
jgi:UDP-N-acetylglucosamine--N-acetylmuramyl-(pentapeptide) pyrophosphoryl-undecaprenol N-acetylglucosamine transferase